MSDPVGGSGRKDLARNKYYRIILIAIVVSAVPYLSVVRACGPTAFETVQLVLKNSYVAMKNTD